MSTQSNCSISLTAHPSGSLRELWVISFPLMLSLLSSSLMYFWDRLLLAQLSLEAHNAATTAGSMALSLQYAFICTATIAEVFVGQANGAGKKKTLAGPVWQMNWLALFSVLFFLPAAQFGGPLLFIASASEPLEITYFSYLMCFSPIFCLNSALSAFYIGRGAVGFATLTMVVSNLINMALAYLLIFGLEGVIAPQGIAGAAVAMGIAQLAQALLLGGDFLSKKNRQEYGTGNYHFNVTQFKDCLRVGLPGALAHTIEMFGWAIFFQMLGTVSAEHLTIASIGQSIFFLFTFITEGISKGAMVIAANMVGARQWRGMWQLLISGIKFYLAMFLALGALFIWMPDILINLFAGADEKTLSSAVHRELVTACFWVWIFLLFDGIHWLVVGLLTAIGDTHFILKTGSTAIWLFALLPAYILVVLGGYPGNVAWAIIACYGAAICAIYLLRLWLQQRQLPARGALLATA
jgi:MATE family multidrug resistance protein